MDTWDQVWRFVCRTIVFFVIVLVVHIFIYMCKRACQPGSDDQTRTPVSIGAQQQDDIFNISSRVQGQDHPWPTHDAYLSIEHINVSNQLNKPNYGDAPPSYEEAMRIAGLNSSGSSMTPSTVVSSPNILPPTVTSQPTVTSPPTVPSTPTVISPPTLTSPSTVVEIPKTTN